MGYPTASPNNLRASDSTERAVSAREVCIAQKEHPRQIEHEIGALSIVMQEAHEAIDKLEKRLQPAMDPVAGLPIPAVNHNLVAQTPAPEPTRSTVAQAVRNLWEVAIGIRNRIEHLQVNVQL